MVNKLLGGICYMKVYIISAVLFALLIGTGLAQNTTTGDVDAFKQALEKDGFTVQQGELGYLDFIKLLNEGLIPSAWGNNPTTKYLTYFVPPAPGHEIDKRFSEIARALGMSGNSASFWNLGPDEAIIFVGRTPPECRYFSFDPNVMSRTYGNETRWLFATFGDTLNNLDINTEGTPNGLPGNPFNQTTMVVTTADRGINQRIRAAALSAGYSGGIINTQIFPSDMLNLGLENNSDTFTTLIRAALYRDKQAGEEYLNNTPAVVLRVTPNQTTQLDPYDVPEIKVRGTGKTEFNLMPDLEQLREAILNKYSGLNATDLPTSIAVPTGSDAIQRGIEGAGPSNDCCYLWSANQTPQLPTPPFFNTSGFYDFLQGSQVTLGNDPHDFIIVYGVNHVATGKATYENCGVNGADITNAVGAISNLDFTGTAEEYLPDNPNAKYLYVYKIARNCNGDPHCFEVPTGPGAYGIRLDQPLFITWRSYLEEATKTGPSYSEIVYDRAIKFSPKE
jgi:hypothetical protein